MPTNEARELYAALHHWILGNPDLQMTPYSQAKIADRARDYLNATGFQTKETAATDPEFDYLRAWKAAATEMIRRLSATLDDEFHSCGSGPSFDAYMADVERSAEERRPLAKRYITLKDCVDAAKKTLAEFEKALEEDRREEAAELERLEAPMDESVIDAFLKMDDDQQLNAYADLYYKLAVRDATIGHLTASLAEALGSPHPARDVIAECNASLASKDAEIERLKQLTEELISLAEQRGVLLLSKDAEIERLQRPDPNPDTETP